MQPALAFDVLDAGTPGIEYGEFDLSHPDLQGFPFKCSLFKVEPGCSTPVDSHAVRECWLVVKGRATLHYDGHSHGLEACSLFFLESHREHNLENLSEEPVTIFSIWWPSSESVMAKE